VVLRRRRRMRRMNERGWRIGKQGLDTRVVDMRSCKPPYFNTRRLPLAVEVAD